MASHTPVYHHHTSFTAYLIPVIILLLCPNVYRTEWGARAGGVAAAVDSAAEGEAGAAGKKPARPQQQQSRKNHEVHPGSYAGGWPGVLLLLCVRAKFFFSCFVLTSGEYQIGEYHPWVIFLVMLLSCVLDTAVSEHTGIYGCRLFVEPWCQYMIAAHVRSEQSRPST